MDSRIVWRCLKETRLYIPMVKTNTEYHLGPILDNTDW